MRFRLTYIFLALFLPFHAQGLYTTGLQQNWESILAQQSFLDLSQQSFCVDGSNISLSYHPTTPIIPASVSKLFLTDWALNTLGKDYTFKTKLSYYKNTLYIQGDYDPRFLPDDLLKSIIELQKQDPNLQIKKVVFSRNFYFNWAAGPIATRVNLQKFASQHPEFFAPKVRVAQVKVPVLSKATSYTHTSSPLIETLKQMNIYSTNSIADIIFAKLGGEAGFQKFANKAYKGQSVDFGVGSGLDRNYTTCQATITMLKRLHKYSTDTATPLSSFIAVPGSDPGNLTKRFPNSSYTNSFVAKDGYIWGVNSIAGIIETQNGPVYYAIFLGYADAWHYKAGAQTVEQMTNTLLSSLPLQKFSYQAKAK